MTTPMIKRFLPRPRRCARAARRGRAGVPAKPIHIVVPFPPGGPTDVLGRLLGQALGDTSARRWWSRTRSAPPATSASMRSRRRRPTATTIGIIPAGNVAVNPTLFANLPYKGSDLAPVTMLATVDNVLVVNAESVPAKDDRRSCSTSRRRSPGR